LFGGHLSEVSSCRISTHCH